MKPWNYKCTKCNSDDVIISHHGTPAWNKKLDVNCRKCGHIFQVSQVLMVIE